MKSQTPIKRQESPAARPKWWTKLSAAIISPLACLILIELVLWIVGYGIPKRFFIPWKVGGRTLYLSNQRYCEHFVPKELSRTPEVLALGPKGKDAIRIFVLGSSAAYGDPDPAYGFCRQLEVLLNQSDDGGQKTQDREEGSAVLGHPSSVIRKPSSGVRFEVVNAAVTAMNSHVARRIAQDAAQQQPDLFIVYMGNNEVIGPCGPTSLPPALYSSRAFINAAITAKKETRIGQLLKNIGEALRSRGKLQQRWQGMEAFLTNRVCADDPRMETCYRHFAANLHDIVQSAHRSGAKTILCTVPTNIASCRPFGSDHAPTLTKDQLGRWQQLLDEGHELAKAGEFEKALSQYEQARSIDGSSADLAFRTGQCLVALGRADQAKAMFIAARDLDTLRFRADSRIEAAIRDAAAACADSGAVLLDLEAKLEDKSKDHLLGDDLLVDHVHLNFQGNFLAAYAAMEAIAKVLPQAGLKTAARTEEQLLGLCRRRLIYDDLEQYRLATVMHQRKTVPPFAGQMDHDADLEQWRQQIVALRKATKGVDTPEASYLWAISQAPLDPYLTVRYGEWLVREKRTAQAVSLYRKVLETWPFDMRIRKPLACALVLAEARDQAIGVLMTKESPDRYGRAEALLLLGTYCGSIGATLEAASICDELNRIAPSNIDGLINRAAAALDVNDLATAKRCLDKALKVNPDSAQTMINLSYCYAKQNQPVEARRCLERSIEIDPYNHSGHIGLGIQLIQMALKANGIEDATPALISDPNFARGIEHVAMAVTLKPDFFEGHQLLAALLSKIGRTEEAKEHAALATLFQP